MVYGRRGQVRDGECRRKERQVIWFVARNVRWARRLMAGFVAGTLVGSLGKVVGVNVRNGKQVERTTGNLDCG